MAEAVVSIALQTLGDLLLEKGKLLFAVGGEVKSLLTQLEEIKCFIQDADKKQHESKTVRKWIAEIRDLAYRSEDVVAEYSVRMSSSSSSDGWGRRLLHGCSGVRHSSLLLQLSSEMLHIKSELERITKAMENNGINKIIEGSAVSSENQILARKSFPNFEIGDCFVGKEEDLKRLVSLVVDDKEHPVISVWGMGGIGKSTIAKKVYTQIKEAKNSCFDCFVWVCISQQCQIRTVLEDILKQMEGGSVSDLSDVQLIERLCEIQTNKRCLIVVDDLWEISHWDALKHAFPLHNLQSKILVTTRKQEVAEIGFSLQLGLLNMEEGLELLQKKAFPQGHILADFQLGEIGKEMVEKCGYLPLAISLIGGLLSKRKSIAELMSVKDNVGASLYRGDGNIEGENEMHTVLNLSYEDLPYYLKPCFLYLGIFKEDAEINADDLCRRWIAQGMISDEMIQGEETLVDIAGLYLGELASRCMLQVEDCSYKVHDVVREFCLSTGKKEEFGVQVLEYRHGNFGSLLPVASQSINKWRHLAMHFPAQVIRPEGGGDLTISNCERLRSLEIFNNESIFNHEKIPFPRESITNFEKFKVLRELLIENFSFEGRKLPRGITKLVHLRYFGLRKCEHLDELPSSICNLVYLETLDLSNSKNLRVPNVFKKMRRFKHLILPRFINEETFRDYRLRLDEGVDEFETLKWFDSRVHELKSTVRMKNLRCFQGAKICDNKSLFAIVNAITSHWKKLQFCSLWIERGCELRSSSDEVLRLEECEIEDPMPMGILGNLHCLTHLTLFRSYVSEEMTCPASSFPNLKMLVLFELEKLREWRVEQGAMPLLSDLRIYDCSNLREWRVEQGAMPHLSQLQIVRCPHLKKVPDEVSSISAEDKLNIIKTNLSGINFSSISEYQREQQFAEEITVEDLILTQEDSEEEMSRHMPIALSDFDSQKRVEPECHGEIQAVDELTTEIDVEKEQQFGEEITVEGLTLTQEDSETEMFRRMPIPLSGFDSQKRVEPESHGEIQAVDELTTEIDVEKEQQFGEEITVEGLTLTQEDSEAEMFRRMPIPLSGFDSQKRVEPESHGEIQAVDELTTEIDVEKEQQFGEEITVEGLTLTQEDSETEMFRHMPIPLSGFDSQKRVEPESHGEIQVVDELTAEIDAEKVSGEQRGTERSKHHEEGISFQEKNPYLVTVEDNHLQLKLDNLQTFLIVDGLDISLANAVLNWAEQDLRELPENPNYPNSLLLFLQRNRRLTLIHTSFFDLMPDLQFLDISDTKIRILPGSLFKLSKLKVLLLRNCVCLDNLPREIGKLNQLEALDLSGTELYDMPDAIGQLGLLRSMQLSFYGPDDESEYQHLPSQLISPSFLSELKEIQALSISVHPEDHRWTEIVARVLNDVSKLEMLSYLQFYFPQVEMFETFIQTSPSWEKQKVSKFDFIVGQNVKRIASRVPDEVESLFNQHERCLRYVNGDRASPLIKTVLIRATAFYLDHHTEVQSLSEFDISNLQELKFCVVRECPKIQTILDEKNVVGAFPCLEHLQIYFLWELKQIWQPPSPGRLKRIFRTPRHSGNFEALRYLIINTCPKLQFILWECMLQCLTNLEELVVEDCERVEKIIKEEKRKVKYENNVLPRLRKLVLHYLPELVSVGNGVCLSEEKISVYGCPKLIHSSQFPNLSHSNIAEE